MSAKIEIPVGTRFDRWVVIGLAHSTRNGKQQIMCRCECGTERPVKQDNLRRGGSRSCGCYTQEVLHRPGRNKTHGDTAGGMHAPEYVSWSSMRNRCLNPKDRCYYLYGGRGITICDRWVNSYKSFLEDMGRKPSPKYTLDRIDGDGNYDPGNCRWADAKTQARNSRAVVRIEVNGECKGIPDWSDQFNIPCHVIRDRLRLGWTAEEAVMIPFTPGQRHWRSGHQGQTRLTWSEM